MRIVSLLPSTTEIVFALGAGDDLVGVTFECDHPPAARSRRIVSTSSLPAGLTPGEIDDEVRRRQAAGEDLYHLDEGALAQLRPDLVLTQDLCAVCAVAVGSVDAALRHLGTSAAVVTLDPMTLTEVLDSVRTVGAALDRLPAAERLVQALTARLAAVADRVAGRPRPRVLVLEWTDPPYTAGHWVPDLVVAAGGEPLLAAPGGRSAATTWDVVRASDPDVVVVAPCGFDLPGSAALAHGLLERGLLPAGVPVCVLDADAVVVRPGPRLVDGVEALAAVLHPGVLDPRPDLARLLAPAPA